MLSDFDYHDMIYFSRYTLLGSEDLLMDLWRDMYRFLIGLVGSIMVLSGLYVFSHISPIGRTCLKFLSWLGEYTFGIYVFQDLMLVLCSPFTKYLSRDLWVFNSLLSFCIIFSFSLWLTIYGHKCRIVAKLFMGTAIKTKKRD